MKISVHVARIRKCNLFSDDLTLSIHTQNQVAHRVLIAKGFIVRHCGVAHTNIARLIIIVVAVSEVGTEAEKEIETRWVAAFHPRKRRHNR